MSSRKTTRSFQVRSLEDWRRFLELCQREGTSGSKKLEEFITQYVREHYPGNPQRPLSVYLHPSPRKVLCPENCRTGVDKSWTDCPLRRRYICRFDS